MYGKMEEVLTGAIPHAEAVGQRWVSGVYYGLLTSQVDQAASGGEVDVQKLQDWLDKGLAALKADPPPAGALARGAQSCWVLVMLRQGCMRGCTVHALARQRQFRWVTRCSPDFLLHANFKCTLNEILTARTRM
jgi:hypothetical protein